MYCLEVIKAMNNRPPHLIDHSNAGCGFNDSTLGLIIHSAAQRSTLSLVSDEAKASFRQWKTEGQRDVWIESFFLSLDPWQADCAVLASLFRSWRFACSFTGSAGQGRLYLATRKSGRSQERLSDTSAVALVCRLVGRNNPPSNA